MSKMSTTPKAKQRKGRPTSAPETSREGGSLQVLPPDPSPPTRSGSVTLARSGSDMDNTRKVKSGVRVSLELPRSRDDAKMKTNQSLSSLLSATDSRSTTLPPLPSRPKSVPYSDRLELLAGKKNVVKNISAKMAASISPSHSDHSTGSLSPTKLPSNGMQRSEQIEDMDLLRRRDDSNQLLDLEYSDREDTTEQDVESDVESPVNLDHETAHFLRYTNTDIQARIRELERELNLVADDAESEPDIQSSHYDDSTYESTMELAALRNHNLDDIYLPMSQEQESRRQELLLYVDGLRGRQWQGEQLVEFPAHFDDVVEHAAMSGTEPLNQESEFWMKYLRAPGVSEEEKKLREQDEKIKAGMEKIMQFDLILAKKSREAKQMRDPNSTSRSSIQRELDQDRPSISRRSHKTSSSAKSSSLFTARKLTEEQEARVEAIMAMDVPALTDTTVHKDESPVKTQVKSDPIREEREKREARERLRDVNARLQELHSTVRPPSSAEVQSIIDEARKLIYTDGLPSSRSESRSSGSTTFRLTEDPNAVKNQYELASEAIQHLESRQRELRDIVFKSQQQQRELESQLNQRQSRVAEKQKIIEQAIQKQKEREQFERESNGESRREPPASAEGILNELREREQELSRAMHESTLLEDRLKAQIEDQVRKMQEQTLLEDALNNYSFKYDSTYLNQTDQPGDLSRYEIVLENDDIEQHRPPPMVYEGLEEFDIPFYREPTDDSDYSEEEKQQEEAEEEGYVVLGEGNPQAEDLTQQHEEDVQTVE
eukprot:GILK01011781.1.p1 GENE.GILK01011781.1~~GILK01011781.1.p1  ORF type:complete len:774 (+),score=170.45 GILK01011781.1:31-2352(+)